MTVQITTEDIKDIDYIIHHIVEKFKDEVNSFEALAWTLQTLLNEKEELEKALNMGVENE